VLVSSRGQQFTPSQFSLPPRKSLWRAVPDDKRETARCWISRSDLLCLERADVPGKALYLGRDLPHRPFQSPSTTPKRDAVTGLVAEPWRRANPNTQLYLRHAICRRRRPRKNGCGSRRSPRLSEQIQPERIAPTGETAARKVPPPGVGASAGRTPLKTAQGALSKPGADRGYESAWKTRKRSTSLPS